MAKILLVEDDDSVRAFVTRALERQGHTVHVACDGGEGLELVRTHEGDADLILSDIQMPVMDGIALALNVSREFPRLPILLMTGYAHQRERTHGLEALIHDVVQKPFSLTDICDKVSEALIERAA